MAGFNDGPLTIVGQGTVGDIIGGSWSIQESATPVDILDSNGSLGQITATFKNNTQGVANTPGTAPTASSDFLVGSTCSWKHSQLGTINGNILSTTPQSSTVGITMSTPLNALNFNANVPAFIDGQMFYSWVPASPTATSVNGPTLPYSGVRAMIVDSSGNVWATGFYGTVTGVSGGCGWVGKWDRFGNHLLTVPIVNASNVAMGQGNGLGLDGSGNLYVLVSSAVMKYNATTGGSATTLISLSSTGDKMVVDRNNNIWVATEDTTASQAIKKYNTSGTLLGQGGTFNTSSTSGNGAFANYVGMAVSPSGSSTDDILVYNLASTGVGTMQLGVQQITASSLTMVGQTTGGILNAELTSYVGGGGYWNGSAGVSRMISQTGIWDKPGNPGTGGNGVGDQVSNALQSPQGNVSCALAYDPNGFGFYVAIDGRIYRCAGGNMNGNLAIECYLGYAGYRGSITYGTNTTRSTVSDTGFVFPAWNGNIWSRIKELCARVKRAISTDGTGLYIIRTDNRSDQYKFSIANRDAPPKITEAQPGAQVIAVTSQNVTGGRGFMNLYATTQNDSLITVDVNGNSVTSLQANAYTTNIIQPRATDTTYVTSWGYTGQSSVYGVIDSSNPPLRVPAATWNASGGWLNAYPSTTTPGNIDIYVGGPSVIAGFTAPFQIGFLSGNASSPGLIINGWGALVNPQTTNVYTSAPINIVQQPVSQTMDSPFIDTMGAAFEMARYSATVLAGGELTLTVDIPIIDITVGFGKAIGGYFFWKRNYWRVTDISYSGGTASLTAVRDTRCGDVQDGSITHGTIDTTWSGFRYQDNYMSPGILGE